LGRTPLLSVVVEVTAASGSGRSALGHCSVWCSSSCCSGSESGSGFTMIALQANALEL
jgi:hypothetical protein